MTAKMGGQGIDEDMEGWLVVEAAGLPEREYPFDPAAALVGVRAEAAFAPEYGETDGSLRNVVGWLDAGLLEKDKEALHFFFQQADELARIAFGVAVKIDKPTEPGEEC